MTKEELLQALLPFTDDIEVLIQDGPRVFEVDHWQYGIDSRGNGTVILIRGAQRLWPGIKQPSQIGGDT